MKRIRLGNTIDIVWEIFLGKDKDKGKYDLTGKKLTIYLVSAFDRIKISDFTTEFNVLRFTFEGKEQKHAGRYQLTFVENEGGDDTRTLDKCDAFELVRGSCMETDDLSEITLASSFDALRIYPIIPQVGPNRNWWVDGVDTGKPSVGLTAYEFAKEQGYEGTEEEYAAECLAVPVLNEESREATEAATKAAEAATIAAKNATDAAESANNASAEASTNASQAAVATASANEAAEKANEAAEKAEETIEAFGPAIANKADLENGKIIPSQLPDYILGQLMYGGLVYSNGSIRTSPFFHERYGDIDTILPSDAWKYKGVYFIVAGEVINQTVAGVANVSTGDWIISTYDSWKKVDNSDAVTSVAGLVGNVNASALAAVLADLTDGNSLARKSEMAVLERTKLEGEKVGTTEPTEDFEINAEIEAKLAELSEANEVLKEAQQFTDVAVKDLQDMKIDRENDDYYPKMAVGLADNLAGVDVVDSEINFRRSGGGAISDGVARIEAIKGNSVVWNMIGKRKNNPASASGITIVDNGDSYTISGTASATVHLYITDNFFNDNTHIYCLLGCPQGGSSSTYYLEEGYTSRGDYGEGYIGSFSKTSGNTHKLSIYVKEGYSITSPLTFKPKVFDLTQMFGAGNEPTTIEEFYQRIPMGVDMNAYNEGEVIHMNVQSIESVGVNQWDEEWELGSINTTTGENTTNTANFRCTNYIDIIGGAKYYGYNAGKDSAGNYYAWGLLYDSDKKLILDPEGYGRNYVDVTNRVFSTAQNARYMRFYVAKATQYNHDICINISDSAINGKYFPYIKRQEDLSLIRKYFPQGMKSAGSAHDEIRYNKASGKWEKVEAIGTRAYQDGDADNASYLTDGKITCYPLAEPIVTELDEADQFKDLDYQVWNAGTEKAIAEGKSAPLAADITYGFNAIGKIKELESLVAALRAKVGI